MSEVNDFTPFSLLLPLPLVCPTTTSQETTKAVTLGCSDFAQTSLVALSLKKGPSPRRDPQALQDLSLEVSPLRWFPPLESFEQLTSVSGQVSLHTEDTLSSGCAQWPCLPGLLLPTLPFKLLLKRLSPHSKPPLVLPPLSALHPASYSSPVIPPAWHSLQSLGTF